MVGNNPNKPAIVFNELNNMTPTRGMMSTSKSRGASSIFVNVGFMSMHCTIDNNINLFVHD